MECGAVEGLIQSVFEGCLSMMDMEIERRPYHRNCSCALHKKRSNRNHQGGGGSFSKACSLCGKVSFPIQRSWSDGSLLSLAAATYYSSSPSSSSSSSSPAHHDSAAALGAGPELAD